MAALATAITNVFEPDICSKYFIEQGIEKSLLVQSGIMASTPEIALAVNQGGRTIEMPFWDDLAHDTATATRSKVATDDDTSITSTGLTTDYDVAVKDFRTQSWSVSPIVEYVAGSDPTQVIMNRYVNWWLKEKQRILLKKLTGVFTDATIKAALCNDISIADGVNAQASNLIGLNAIEDTRFLLGDSYDKFTAMIMHSVVFKRLRLLNQIDMVPDSDQELTIPTYNGLRVIVDDGMTKVAGATSGYKYYTYLFGAGAIAYQDIPITGDTPNVELYKQPLKGTGAGQLDIITRNYFIMHPRGIKYTGSLSAIVSPSDSDYEADNWTQVYLTKNIRIAQLITNG